LGRLDVIDKSCEMFGLTAVTRQKQKDLPEQLNRFLRQEELKWKQKV
jgi:hypothetical protein